MAVSSQIARLQDIWPSLTMDEKRYLVVRSVFVSDIEAARKIGRNQDWLSGHKKKATFQKALAAVIGCANFEVAQLMDEDMEHVLRSELAQHIAVESGGRSKKETMDALKAVHGLRRASRARLSEGAKEGENSPEIDWEKLVRGEPDWAS